MFNGVFLVIFFANISAALFSRFFLYIIEMSRKTRHCRKDVVWFTEKSQKCIKKWLLLFKTNYLLELQLFVTFDQSETSTDCVLQKNCTWKCRNIHQKAPVLEIFLRLQNKFFPKNNAKILRAPILKNSCKWLLLYQCHGTHILIRSSVLLHMFWYLSCFHPFFKSF